MGRRYDEVSQERRLVPYKVVAGDNGDARVEAGGKSSPPPEVSAMILAKLKEAAEAYLARGHQGSDHGCPTSNDAQRQATKDGGKIGRPGGHAYHQEPTRSTAYGLDRKRTRTIAVYDFGGGTFDISILEVATAWSEVKSTNGEPTWAATTSTT